MKPPSKDRLSYSIQLDANTGKSTDYNTAVFRYDYPISWIIQCYYFGFTAAFANTSQLKAWFKSSGADAADKWFYTSYLVGDSAFFFNQSIVSYFGSTYKVFGKDIQGHFATLSDSGVASLICTATPQVVESAGAFLEANEQDFKVLAGVAFQFPTWATHFTVLGQLVDGVQLYAKNGITLITEYNQLSAGQYIKIPFDCLYIKCATEIRIGVKFFGIE